MPDTKPITNKKVFVLTVRYRCKVWRDDDTGVFIGYCKKLDVYSQGKSKHQAKLAIESAIKMHLRFKGVL